MTAPDHVAAALRYAKGVVAGKIPACKWVRLAAKRHLDDLKHARDKDYPYWFDPDAGQRVCVFAQLLPHTKGKWAREKKTIRLEPWQQFVLVVLFGWLRRRDDRRRFRVAYLEIPRKNGKSIIAAAIGLYMLVADGEHGAEVYSGATTEKQAWEVFRPARTIVQKFEELRELTGLEVWAKALAVPETGAKFEPLIGKPGDGASPSCAIVDEYHEHDTPDFYDTMETGMGAREQPLMLVITTSGYNLAGPCFDKRKEVERMLDGVTPNDELFGVIWTIDEGDDWSNPKALIKANPNYGVSVDGDFLLSMQRNAKANATQQNRFKTKHLNLWCNARSAWMPMDAWKACADPKLSIEDFAGQPAVFILDLASRVDICVFGQLFTRQLAGQTHYYWFSRRYLPEDTANEPGTNQATYVAWAKQGLLFLTDGAEIDFDEIREDVRDMGQRIEASEVAYDPWRATQLAHQLAKDGATVVEVRQTVQNLSPAMKEIEAAVRAGRWHHAGDPVTDWMVSNVVAKLDAKDNIYPRKDKPEMKIDEAVAMIMGVARTMEAALADDEQPEVVLL